MQVEVDLAALGPRKDPLPMASDVAPDWVEGAKSENSNPEAAEQSKEDEESLVLAEAESSK